MREIPSTLPTQLEQIKEKSARSRPKATFPNTEDFQNVSPLIHTEIHEKLQNSLNAFLRDQKEEEEPGGLVEIPCSLLFSANCLPISAQNRISDVHFTSDQIRMLFKEMVGEMTQLTKSGIQETTLTLNTPEFSSSVFHGTTITIREYSTAPKIFNVHLSFSPEALTLFQAHAAQLVAAFQKNTHNFQVNRLDADLLSEQHPFFHRKEEKEHDKHNQKEEE